MIHLPPGFRIVDEEFINEAASLRERSAKLEEGLVLAFVQGARWWEWQREGVITSQRWSPSDQALAQEQGEQRLRNNTLGRKPPFPPDLPEVPR